jgi:hypothetical protein
MRDLKGCRGLILRRAQDDGGVAAGYTVRLEVQPGRVWSFDRLRMTAFERGSRRAARGGAVGRRRSPSGAAARCCCASEED